MQSVLAGRQRAGFVTAEDAEALRKPFLADVGSQAIDVVSLSDRHYTAAETLIRKHAGRQRLRTLDALQLSVVLSVSEKTALKQLVSADRVLCAVATGEGLPVMNPED